MRFRATPPLVFFVLFLLSLPALGTPARAACAWTGGRCVLDSQCCPGLLCGPGGVCASGCRIDGAFVRSGTRSTASPCQACQPSRSATAWTDLATGATCNDGNPCTNSDTCRSGACVGGPPPSCNDSNRCTIDACDPALGCVHSPVVCDDANACTIDSCSTITGLCQFRSNVSACDDRNPCTDDSCAPASGCLHAPRTGACDDRSVCTVGDVCDLGRCVSGPPLDCDDQNPWTRDSCDSRLGCRHEQPSVPLSPPGAFLFFPDVVATNAPDPRVETSLTITNAGSTSIVAHVSFVNGDRSDARYCYECDFDAPLAGWETQTLVVSRSGSTTRLLNQTTGASRSCPHARGFVTVDVESATHLAQAQNVLAGYEVVVRYASGSAFSLPALSFRGTRNNGDRAFMFDASEYAKLPAALRTDFTPPDQNGPTTAELFLFTPAFQRQMPPLTDCSVIATNRYGAQFSSSFQFGCFTTIRLQDIDPELAREDFETDRGSIELHCTVNGTGPNGVVTGGVHGALVQTDAAGNVTGTLLIRSTQDGSPATLRLADPAR